MTLPNFLVIGAAKAGTTSVYYYLKQHPQIYLPRKEPDFFALEGEKLEYPAPKGTFKAHNRITDIDTYTHLFDEVTHEIAIGDVSPSYLYHPKAPSRIKHYIPDTKLIVILRDPAERAFSHYLFWASQGFEPETDFDFNQAIKAESKRIDEGWYMNWHYLGMGFYYQQLKRYFDLFDSSQIKIYLYEDLVKDQTNCLQNIFEFLAVDQKFIPNLAKTHNSTQVPKNKTVNFLLNRPNPWKMILKPLLPTQLRQKIADKIKQRNLGKPKLSPSNRQQLIEVYREDLLKLQDLIERDLSKWLQ